MGIKYFSAKLSIQLFFLVQLTVLSYFVVFTSAHTSPKRDSKAYINTWAQLYSSLFLFLSGFLTDSVRFNVTTLKNTDRKRITAFFFLLGKLSWGHSQGCYFDTLPKHFYKPITPPHHNSTPTMGQSCKNSLGGGPMSTAAWGIQQVPDTLRCLWSPTLTCQTH